MEITKEIIKGFKEKYPECKLVQAGLKGKDEKTVELEVVVRSPDRKVISEAEKWENTNPGKSKEIYVRNCVLTDVEKVMADDNLFYQAYFVVVDLLPFQKPEVIAL